MQPEGFKILGTLVLVLVLFVACLSGYLAHLRHVAPAPSEFDREMLADSALQRFRKLDAWANITCLMLTLVFGVGVYCILVPVAALREAALPPAELTLTMPRVFLVLVAAFSGLGLAIATSLPWMMRTRPEDARWYATHLAVRRYRCDYQRLARDFGWGLVVLGMLLLPLGLNTYVQVRPDEFAVHGFFSLREQAFPYRDIERIETAAKFVAPNGRIRYDRDYVVHFRGGSKWVASSLPSGGAQDSQRVAELLSQKSRVPINEVPIFSTRDLYDWF